jgi:hypothetical protein
MHTSPKGYPKVVHGAFHPDECLQNNILPFIIVVDELLTDNIVRGLIRIVIGQ